jgi:hypothetical protein
MCGIGIVGTCWLWKKWRKEYVWLTGQIFLWVFTLVQDMQRTNTVKAGPTKLARWLAHHVSQCYNSSQ